MKVKYRPCGCIYQIEEECRVSRNPSPPPGTPLPLRPICRLKPEVEIARNALAPLDQCLHLDVLNEEKSNEVQHVLSLSTEEFFNLWEKSHEANYPPLSQVIATVKQELGSPIVSEENWPPDNEHQEEVVKNEMGSPIVSEESWPPDNERQEEVVKNETENKEPSLVFEHYEAPAGASQVEVVKSERKSDDTREKEFDSLPYKSSRREYRSPSSSDSEHSYKSHKESPRRRKSESKYSRRSRSPSPYHHTSRPASRMSSKDADDSNVYGKKSESKYSYRSRSPSPYHRTSRPASRMSRKDSDDSDVYEKKKESKYSCRSRSPSPYHRTSRPASRMSSKGADDSEMYEIVGNSMFYCKYCSATMHSESTWATHLNGKRHAKNVRLQNLHKVIVSTISDQVNTRYPPVPPEMQRIKTNDVSPFQYIIDKFPVCPGLNDVVEIQSPINRDVMYYCELCDAPCSVSTIMPHLRGIKHYMRCLKRIDPKLYDRIENDTSRPENKEKLKLALLEDERKRGRGRIRVERDVPIENFSAQPSCSSWNRDFENPKDSVKRKGPLASKIQPDTSKNDFYCQICDSHMNNSIMWDAHVRGKRHLKNAKKAPGEKPSGTKYVRSYVEAKLLRPLSNIYVPIVGLDYIKETQNPEAGETYNCFLCGASCSTDIFSHLQSVNHRIKYLKRINDESIEGILQLEVSTSSRASLIEERCHEAELKYGRGKVEVYVKTV